MARTARRLDSLALASFVALGLPDGMLGTAWPSMRRDLGAPVGELGLILLASTVGAIAVAVVVGRLMRRFGVAAVLVAGGVSAAGGAGGFAAAPGVGTIFGLAVLFGVASGLWDGGLNTAVALARRNRLLNLLHGAYGVGTTVGPLLVTTAVILWSWRGAYLVLLAVDLGIAGTWLVVHHRGAPAVVAAPAPGEHLTGPGPAGRPERMRSAVLAGVAVFFLYTGLEVSAGQWETTFGRDHLHLSTTAAGLATFGYWAALTVVRMALGILPRGISDQKVIRYGTVVAVGAAGVVWWAPATAVVIAAFALLGASLAGIFPSLVALTPARLGEEAASRVIAWQVGAAAVGGAGLSALVGLIISVWGLTALGPALVVMAVALVGGRLANDRLAPTDPGLRRGAGAPAGTADPGPAPGFRRRLGRRATG